MSDTLITVVAILLAVVLLVVIPLQVTSQRVDTMSKLDVDTLTSNFVDKIRTVGGLTKDDYNNFTQTLTATGNTYDVNMEFKILDENPGKKTTQTVRDKIGENVYYSVYTSQIEQGIEDSKDNKYSLKEGDIVSVTVRNTNLTIGQQLKNFAYKIVGNDTYTISASKSGLVVSNGSTSSTIANNAEKPELTAELKENDSSGKVITKKDSSSTEISNRWTNKNVYAEFSSKNYYDLDLTYFIRSTMNNNTDYITGYKKLDGNNYTETREGEYSYQVFWKTNGLEKYSEIANIKIRIDRTSPVIKSVSTSTVKGNTSYVAVSAEDDKSGIAGYYYTWTEASQTPSAPDVNADGWTTANYITVGSEKDNKKCTVWVKDNAGNISKTGKSVIIKDVVPRIVGVNLEGAIIKNGETGRINVTLIGGNDYKDIKYTISDGSIATITPNGTQVLIAGKKAGKATITCTVTNYDGSTQTATSIISVVGVEFSPNGGYYSISYINKSEKLTLASTVTVYGDPNKTEYGWTNSSTQQPSSWKAFTSGRNVTNTVTNIGEYYLWIRLTDQYNNSSTYISNRFYVKYKVPDASGNIKANYSNTNWTNGNVTVTVSSEIKDFTLQTSTDGKNWTNDVSREFGSNGTMYARFYYEKEKEAGDPMTISVTNIDKSAPTASSVEIKNVTTTGYDVYVYGVSDSQSGVNRVQFPTWTEYNGQDDIQGSWWANSSARGSQSGSTWIYHVNTSDHKNEFGLYNTHIYVYDNLGNSNCIWTGTKTIPFYVFNYGLYPGYNFSAKSEYRGHSWGIKIGDNALTADGKGNKSMVIYQPIQNRGFTKCYVDLEVSYDNHNSSDPNGYYYCDMLFSYTRDILNANGQTNWKQFDTVWFANNSNHNNIPRKTFEINLSGESWKDFYIGFHNCDSAVRIYRIWFE